MRRNVVISAKFSPLAAEKVVIDNFRCNRCRTFCQNVDIFVSMIKRWISNACSIRQYRSRIWSLQNGLWIFGVAPVGTGVFTDISLSILLAIRLPTNQLRLSLHIYIWSQNKWAWVCDRGGTVVHGMVSVENGRTHYVNVAMRWGTRLEEGLRAASHPKTV